MGRNSWFLHAIGFCTSFLHALCAPSPALCDTQCQVRSIDATLWCCGFAEGAPGADARSSLESLAVVVRQLAPSLDLGLPKEVPRTAVTKALSVLKKSSTLPSDMYI